MTLLSLCKPPHFYTYTILNTFLFSRRAKDDTLAKEESDFKNRVDKSLENLRQKMERELEDQKLEMLEVGYSLIVIRTFSSAKFKINRIFNLNVCVSSRNLQTCQ